MPIVEFYFDFVSPYSYIAFILLQRLKEPWGLEIVYKPVRLPYIVKTAGNHPPASVPKKAAFQANDLTRTAAFYQIPLNPPREFLHISMKAPALLVCAAKKILSKTQVVMLIDAIWNEFFGKGNGKLFTADPMTLRPIMHGILTDEDMDKVLNEAVSKHTEEELYEMTNSALEVGAFGAPTMVVTLNGTSEVFFGSDRFHHIAAFLKVDPTLPYNRSKI